MASSCRLLNKQPQNSDDHVGVLHVNHFCNVILQMATNVICCHKGSIIRHAHITRIIASEKKKINYYGRFLS